MLCVWLPVVWICETLGLLNFHVTFRPQYYSPVKMNKLVIKCIFLKVISTTGKTDISKVGDGFYKLHGSFSVSHPEENPSPV